VICFDAKGYGFRKTSVSRKHDHQIIELERIISALCDQPLLLWQNRWEHWLCGCSGVWLLSRLVVVNVPIIFSERLPHWNVALSQMPLELLKQLTMLV